MVVIACMHPMILVPGLETGSELGLEVEVLLEEEAFLLGAG
jgi:hypothetical protein